MPTNSNFHLFSFLSVHSYTSVLLLMQVRNFIAYLMFDVEGYERVKGPRKVWEM